MSAPRTTMPETREARLDRLEATVEQLAAEARTLAAANADLVRELNSLLQRLPAGVKPVTQ
jgi:cell division protein FtsB